MRDKIAGALYGMALGDAMGMPAELWGRERARKFFGKKIEGFLDGPEENEVAFNYEHGQFTDDTGQALVLLDSIAATDYVPDARDIALRMIAWAEKENAWENNILGPTSKIALANFRDGIEDSKPTDKALSNGSAMRIPPIGCLFAPDRKRELVKKYGEDEELLSQKLYDIVGTGVCIIESVAAAYYTQDPNKACLFCANMGGDTDTIGAMATAICGAFKGMSAIHPEYIETLQKQNDVDFDTYIDILMRGREKLK